MEGLDDFEKQLAAEKAERDRGAQKEERRERKHRHRDDREKDDHRRSHRDRDGESSKSHRHHRHRDDDQDDEGHRHKRSRHSKDDEGRSSRRHRSKDRDAEKSKDKELDPASEDAKFLNTRDPKDLLPLPDEEKTPALERDSWMTAPSALDVDYIHRKDKNEKPPPKEEPKRVLHHRELNRGLDDVPTVGDLGDTAPPTERDMSYTFGDEGSQWRMTKLKSVYTIAEQTGRQVDEVAVERFGSLAEFDDAREEKVEVDRRKVYGAGYAGKDKPSGELFRERRTKSSPSPEHLDTPEQGVVIEEQIQPAARLDQTSLNRLRAQMMKAKLRNSPDAAKLEAEYNAAAASFSAGGLNTGSNPVVLDATHNRMLAGARGEVKTVDNKRGRERGTVVENDEMSLDDMVREERRTRGAAGGEGQRLAERIAKDAKFDNDLEYLDENAEKLARRVHKSEASLKNMAVSEFQKLNKILDTCPLCHHEDRAPPNDQPVAPVVSLATRVYLTLPPQPELTGAEGGAVLVPISHRTNLLECDDDEWEEMRNFMKSLTRLYHEQGRDVIFYENAASPGRRRHAALVAVPIPYELGETAPAFFKEAMLSADEEWSQHKKIIDTGKKAREGMGKLAFRRSIAKEMPYFHVWFTLDGGLGHIVEDAGRWPKGDLFAREIIGGMLDAEPDVVKRQGKWTRQDSRVEEWRRRWRKFDWTRVLTEG
ncbi:CwfJ C-terminus 1-domain-containing protein-like protein [Coniochaeta sp. 2T2.1]|nr:CwfJ C-terminus 1-domain-containing protein-like protein [Coniochaeta sp. 2T2.1]